MNEQIRSYLEKQSKSDNETTRYASLLILGAADMKHVELLKDLDWTKVRKNLSDRRKRVYQ